MSLSNDGMVVAVSASSGKSAYVRIFKWKETETEWMQLRDAIFREEDMGPVSLSDDGMIVGISSQYSMNARVYKWKNAQSSWIQMGEDIDGKPGTLFGASISLSNDGTVAAIGRRAPDSGLVRIMKWETCPPTIKSKKNKSKSTKKKKKAKGASGKEGKTKKHSKSPE